MKTQLNQNQQQVVDTLEGPVLVIAGPGSGKTKTLVERVVTLLRTGVEPESIMIATFTEKAAKELLTRISNQLIEEDLKVNPNDLYIGTLHSIFLDILKENREYTRIKRNCRLLEPFEQTFLVYTHMSRFKEEVVDLGLITNPNNHDFVARWECAQAIVKKINIVSEEALVLDRLRNANDLAVMALAQCYDVYYEILTEENALDFSTIQTEMLSLIEENPQVLASIQEKIKYFMIDEYQDTNTIQERILLKLASLNNNICVVGDDDQGLYRFRGATIRNILQFAENFTPGQCKKIYLSTNYRSHPGIISFYDQYMQSKEWTFDNQMFRFDKTIVPCDREFVDTASVVRVSSDSEEVEDYYNEVLNFINHLREKKIVTDYNQITFLYRSVKSSEAVEMMEFLEASGIQVFSPRSNQFFNRHEIVYLIGALLALFPQVLDSEDIVREGSFKEMLKEYFALFINKLHKDKEKNKSLIAWILSLQNLHVNLSENADYAFTQLIYKLFQFPLFAQWLDVDLTASKTDLRPGYNVGIFIKLVTRFEYLYNITVLTPTNLERALRRFFNEYLRFVMEGGMEEFEDFDEIVPPGCVSFMTIHQSKGLEFPITIVGSMSANPRRSYDALEEILQNHYYNRPVYEPLEQIKYFDFYRLFYTAFSRAQNLLVLTGKEKKGRGALPSKQFSDVWHATPHWTNSEFFNPEKLDLASVHAANIKHEYSFTSHILMYESCPLQYKFYKEFGFTAVRTGSFIGGTLLHETIEDIHKAVLRGESHDLSDDRITSWFNDNYEQLVKTQQGYLHEPQRKALLRQVLRYRDNNSDRWHTIKETEVDVSLVRPDYILKGKIDLVEGENGMLDIIDFKSGDKPDVNTRDEIQKKMLEQYRRQLEVYAFVIEQKTGKKINNMHLYYPKEESGNPRITYTYKPDSVAETINSFEGIVKKIEARNFSMEGHSCSEKVCRECDLRHYCHKM